MLTRLNLDSALLPALAPLRRLLRSEPVSEVAFVAGFAGPRAAVAVRTLLPFAQPVRVAVRRVWAPHGGPQAAFLSALLSAPVLASATALDLNGVNAGGANVPLASWLAGSPFLGGVRSLNLAGNRLTDADARALARAPNLRGVCRVDVTNNGLIGDAGKIALAKRFGAGLVV